MGVFLCVRACTAHQMLLSNAINKLIYLKILITWIPSSCHSASVILWRIRFVRCEIYSLILSSASLRETGFVIVNEKKKQYAYKNFTIYTSWRPRRRRRIGIKIWRWFVAITSCLENSVGKSCGVLFEVFYVISGYVKNAKIRSVSLSPFPLAPLELALSWKEMKRKAKKKQNHCRWNDTSCLLCTS